MAKDVQEGKFHSLRLAHLDTPVAGPWWYMYTQSTSAPRGFINSAEDFVPIANVIIAYRNEPK